MFFIIFKIYLSTYDASKLIYLYDIYFFNIKLFVVDHAGTYSFYQWFFEIINMDKMISIDDVFINRQPDALINQCIVYR